MRVLGLDVGSRTIGVAVTDELGVAAHPAHVRATWLRLHRAVVDGATPPQAEPERLARLLYGIDLLLVLLWTQDRRQSATRAGIDRLAPLIDLVAPLLGLPAVGGAFGELAAVFSSLTKEKSS
jgi:hypothetical protein